MDIIVHTDGGARGNPGPAAIGVIIEKENLNAPHEKTVLVSFGKKIGESTNNMAEYTGVLEALTWIKNSRHILERAKMIQIFLDSSLVVNQLNGLYKIKNANLRSFLTSCRILEQEIGIPIRYGKVSREKNKYADMLVNQALDDA